MAEHTEGHEARQDHTHGVKIASLVRMKLIGLFAITRQTHLEVQLVHTVRVAGGGGGGGVCSCHESKGIYTYCPQSAYALRAPQSAYALRARVSHVVPSLPCLPFQTHVPGYVKDYEKLKGQGVELVACVSVNDAFVMDAWEKDQNATGKVRMLADTTGEFTKVCNSGSRVLSCRRLTI